MESSTCGPDANNDNVITHCEGFRRLSDCPCRMTAGNSAENGDNSQRLMEAEMNHQNFLDKELHDRDSSLLSTASGQYESNAAGKYAANNGGGLGGRVDSNGAAYFSRISSHTQQYTARVGKYLMAVHRKITRQDSYFLSHHKTRPSIFGVPLIIPNVDGGTNKDLYCAVWLQVSRLLSPLPAATEQANHAADW